MATITFTSAGAIQATSFTASSSRKVKREINPTLISALDVINSTDVVDFKYIDDFEDIPHVGFIAEDTDSILSTPDKNGMDYTNCIGVLIKAVQELSKKVDSLESKIK